MASLKRLSDGSGDSGARSEAYKYVNGKYTVFGNRPTVGYGMLVGSINARTYQQQDYWQTSAVTEILEETEDYVKFKTTNSIYEWRQ